MASSTPTSPAASREGSPAPLLSPRSKIKALLATVDSSDDEHTTAAKPRKSSATVADDSDSDVPVRPRGKLASKMQAASTTSPSRINAARETPTDARERVRRMLQPEEADKTPAEEVADGGGDEELPVGPRRLQRRSEAASTQENGGNSPKPASPGLFLSSPARQSPEKSVVAHSSGSEADLPSHKSDRFKALVERKRKERLAREAEEERIRAERQEKLLSEMTQLQSEDERMDGISDDEGGHRMSLSAAPQRKASKQAMEEIERETQRIQRNMQLKHAALTRKKVTKSSLFDRFNYRPVGEPEPAPEKPAPPLQQLPSSSRPTTPPSEHEMKDAETPPSSPPTSAKRAAAVAAAEAAAAQSSTAIQAASKEIEGQTKDVVDDKTPKAHRRVQVRMPIKNIGKISMGSDDELEVMVNEKDKIKAIFDNVPKKKAEDASSLQVFRAFAMANSPERVDRRKRGPSGTMTSTGLQASLQQRARAQAKIERDRRMATLKAQGITIQTAEERERQEAEVEDLVAKAREEAQRLMKQEREEDKKSRAENGEHDPLAWDDSDEEYQDSANEADVEGSELELSGSEDEEASDGDNESGEEDDGVSKPIFDDDAAEVEAPEEAVEEVQKEIGADEGILSQPIGKRRRARNVTAILSDDDVDMEVEATPRPPKFGATQASPKPGTNDSPLAPGSVLRSAKKTFIPGLPVQGPAGMGLTQIFAGTMDSQMSPSGPTQSMMPDFDQFPDSNFSATAQDDVMEDVIKSSQPQEEEETHEPENVRLNLSQSQMHGLDSIIRNDLFTQATQDIEPSQDVGLQTYTPLRERFVDVPQATMDTVIQSGQLDQQESKVQDSPLVRRGRLRRKIEPEPAASDEVRVTQDINVDAFAAMKEKAAKEGKRRLADEFNRKKSKAKEMVEEQAEESEDEYAGVGGADGEDSDNESNASVQEMIDDDASNNVDEGKLAAFYADRERADDEKAVEKLFKDITTGMLRRKRGADYDLSDSDDGGEARRRMKRRQFAKMQKALFADERVKKIASDPGNQAFLRTIEDQGSDDEIDLLGAMDTDNAKQDDSDSPAPSQDVNNQQVIPDSQPRKALASSVDNRAPAHMRRTKDGKKPSNIGEVRETLSDLLEDPEGSLIPATEAGSDSEDDAPSSNKENASPNRRRSRAVVDRISLKRTNSNASTGSNSRLAFSATSSSSGFKVPMLLRRATTNSSFISTSTSSSSAGKDVGMGGFGDEGKIKKAASKKSGVVRGVERVNEGRAKMEENERRREERKVRGAKERVGIVSGLLGKGSFA